jgi:16S rRNA (guanine966-N2)-methyltransferase
VPRIVGGTAGGRRIDVPRGRDTRPTSDRVREGLFSSLEAIRGPLTGAAFLDLFAGSGAVGLEAASRGAVRIVLVEQSAVALRTLRANVTSLELPGVEVHAVDVDKFLAGTPTACDVAVPAQFDVAVPAQFDIVFLDPPYADAIEPSRSRLAGSGWLAAAAVVVVERATRSGAPVWPAGLEEDRSRRYGDTTLWYGRAS